ncbi:MAG: serine hydrolase [Gemmatimonadota bacterium]|nr:MAG: serine hydrolase [Gemmatimonadota bacterium]
MSQLRTTHARWWRRAGLVAATTVVSWVAACGGESGITGPSVCSGPSDPVDPADLGDGSGYPAATWAVAPSPASLGWDCERLADAVAQAQVLGSGALLVIDRGVVVLDWGTASGELVVQSVRKSFMSALYGIYHAEGDIDLALTMEQLGIDDIPPSLTTEEKQATVEMLLKARSGVYHEAAAESQSMKDARPARGSHPPGTFWYYNNWDFNALGTIFTQLTGLGTFEALEQRLAVPLQMQDFAASDGFYQYELELSEHPAYHLNMSARDMARFGLLFLRNGRWRDQQIVPQAWVTQSTTGYSDAALWWDYGYMWWVGKPAAWDGHELYAALGGSGHMIAVVTDLDLVIVHRVDYDTWRGDWFGVYSVIKQILAAR